LMEEAGYDGLRKKLLGSDFLVKVVCVFFGFLDA
jgi:hypothetical protein